MISKSKEAKRSQQYKIGILEYDDAQISKTQDGFEVTIIRDGENLTIDHLDEENIFAGDLFEVGECLLQAVQPRVPCFKLGIRFGDQGIIQKFNDLHRCGVYFRVKKEGLITAGDTFKLIGSEKIKASISELFQFIKDKGVTTKSRTKELAQIQSLNEKWKIKFLQLSQDSD